LSQVISDQASLSAHSEVLQKLRSYPQRALKLFELPRIFTRV